MRTAREAAGPDVELMVDAEGSEQYWPHGVKWALETARMLAGYQVTWFEEALPDDLEGFVALRAQALPISGGRCSPAGRASGPGSSGAPWTSCSRTAPRWGLSEARRIAWMAQDHNVLFVTHGWNTAIGLAADLHLVAAIPAARGWYLTPSPFIEEIITTPFRLDADGLLPIPGGPGLGVELDPQGVASTPAGASG